MKAMPRKSATHNCFVIAGPNGAGKTTFATEFLPQYANCRNFINADLIARAYSRGKEESQVRKRLLYR